MKRRSLPWILLALLLPTSTLSCQSIPAVVETSEGAWPGWAGPEGTRVGMAGDHFALETFDLAQEWNREIGPGYSSLAIVDGVAMVPYSDGERDLMAAFDREGAEIWRYDLGPTYEGHDGSDDGPLATPTVAGDAVYLLAPRGALVALHCVTGELLWKRELAGGFETEPPYYGFASSALVAGDVVVALTGAGGGRSLVGLNRETGEDVWAFGDDSIGYQSPALMEFDGVPQVVAVTNQQMIGVEPASGRVLWSHLLDGGSDEGSEHPIPVGEDGILLTTENGATLYRWSTVDGVQGVEVVWSGSQLRGYATPVYLDGHLYGYAGRILVCVNAETGEAVWKSREPGGGMLIAAGDQLVIQTGAGKIVVVDASWLGYRERASFAPFESGYPSVPAFADGRIYARSPLRLASLSIVPGAAPPGSEESETVAPAEDTGR